MAIVPSGQNVSIESSLSETQGSQTTLCPVRPVGLKQRNAGDLVPGLSTSHVK